MQHQIPPSEIASGVCASVGIVSYGYYLPSQRLDISLLAEQWELSAGHERVYRLNGRNITAVQALDEDAITLAAEAGQRALDALSPGDELPRSVLVGSESHPYSVKPTSVVVAEILGLCTDVFAADLEFACKGGTAAVLISAALSQTEFATPALAIGSDCPQSAPGSLLEASVGAGASAVLLGKRNVIARIEAVASVSSDVSDFWRRDMAQYPSVAGKFSVDIGYRQHTENVIEKLLALTGSKPSDYKYLCLHQPYASLPMSVASKLGFSRDSIRPGLVSGRVGNTYSSATLLSLCGVLDQAEPGDRIMLASFGSGAGSDGIVIKVTEHIEAFRHRTAALGRESLSEQLENGHVDWLTYGQYALLQGKLRL